MYLYISPLCKNWKQHLQTNPAQGHSFTVYLTAPEFNLSSALAFKSSHLQSSFSSSLLKYQYPQWGVSNHCFNFKPRADKTLSIPKFPECFQQQKHQRDPEDKCKNNKAEHQDWAPKRRQEQACSHLEYKSFPLTPVGLDNCHWLTASVPNPNYHKPFVSAWDTKHPQQCLTKVTQHHSHHLTAGTMM